MGKFFIVADDVGNPLFFDSGSAVESYRMVCMQYAATQDLMKVNFGQQFKSLRCLDNTMCLFQMYDSLLFIIICNEQQQSEPYLRRQLHLIYEMMHFKFGLQMKKHLCDTNQRKRQRAEQILHRFIDTVCFLCDNEQSFLVQSIERLEVNDELRGKCLRALDEACRESPKNASHALLFVGTKLVAHFARPKSFDLTSGDIFLITVFFHSFFVPKHSEAPVEPAQQTPGVPTTETTEHTDDSSSVSQTPIRLRAASSVPAPPFSPGSEQEASTDVAWEKVYLHSPNLEPFWLYCAQVAEATTLVIVNECQAGTEDEERVKMDDMRGIIRASLANFIDFLIIKAQTHVTMLSYLHYFPGLVHFLFVDRTNQQVVAPTIVPLHGADPVSLTDDVVNEASLASIAFLKNKVWDMCKRVQQRVADGFTSMTLRKDGLIYTYRLWIEDGEGNELLLALPVLPHDVSVDSTFLKDLIRRLYPKHQNVNCFELYAMYVGTLSDEAVAEFNTGIVAQLRDSRPTRMISTLQYMNW